MMASEKIRVLIAKPGLDGHDVGGKVVARALMDAGHEVIYTGLRKSPEEIAAIASDEDVAVIGLSILSGSHIPLCRQLAPLLEAQGKANALWIVGGNIPARDHQTLRDLGVDGVFQTGTPLGTIVDYIEEKCHAS